MDVGLLIAGLICVAMAFGHQTIGVVWVLPSLTEEQLPRTPFGPPALTLAMVRVTWNIVTIFVLAIAGLLLALAWNANVEPRVLLLRGLAATWFAATVMALLLSAKSLRSLRSFMRLPVPLLWVIVAVLCWNAST